MARNPTVPAAKRRPPALRLAVLAPNSRRRDPERTKHDILDVAIDEFAGQGLSGARVDTIAARTKSSKRMIYYYFGSKEGLYQACLEHVFGAMFAAEQHLDLARLAPSDAIRKLVAYQFDYEESHPELTRFVSIENIHDGKYLARSHTLQRSNSSILETLATILKRGRRAGVFRAKIEPVDLHLLIVAPCFFRVANRATFGAAFGADPFDPRVRARQRSMLADAVVAYLEAPPPRRPRKA